MGLFLKTWRKVPLRCGQRFPHHTHPPRPEKGRLPAERPEGAQLSGTGLAHVPTWLVKNAVQGKVPSEESCKNCICIKRRVCSGRWPRQCGPSAWRLRCPASARVPGAPATPLQREEGEGSRPRRTGAGGPARAAPTVSGRGERPSEPGLVFKEQ